MNSCRFVAVVFIICHVKNVGRKDRIESWCSVRNINLLTSLCLALYSFACWWLQKKLRLNNAPLTLREIHTEFPSFFLYPSCLFLFSFDKTKRAVDTIGLKKAELLVFHFAETKSKKKNKGEKYILLILFANYLLISLRSINPISTI